MGAAYLIMRRFSDALPVPEEYRGRGRAVRVLDSEHPTLLTCIA